MFHPIRVGIIIKNHVLSIEMSCLYLNRINFLSKSCGRTLLLLFGLTFLLLASCDIKKQEQNNIFLKESQKQMAIDTLVQACWNKKELSKLELVMTENVSRRVNNIIVANNRKEVGANLTVFINGFPDLFISISNLHLSDKSAIYNWTFTATNTGVFGEFPATGKKVKVNGMTKLIFNEGGKIVEEDVSYNELDLLQQLGYTLNPPNFE